MSIEVSDRLLKLGEVKLKTGVGTTWIYSRIKTGGFPAPLKLSEGCVRWKESDIDAWIASLPINGAESRAD